MASALKNLSTYDASNMPSAEGMTIGIVVTDYHKDITYALYEGCYDTLVKHGAKEENIHTVQVPGAFELPAGARILGQAKTLDGIVCLGCVIKGETNHNEYINQAVANALMSLSVAAAKPVIFGVLTPNTHEQALERAGGRHGNKGIEAAVTVIRMIALKKGLQKKKGSIGFGKG